MLVIGENALYKFDIDSKEIMEKYLCELGEELEVDISDYTFAANYIWLSNVSGLYAIVSECL